MILTEDLVSMLRHLADVLERERAGKIISSGDTIVQTQTDPEQEKTAFLRVSYTFVHPDEPDKLTENLRAIGCELVYDEESCKRLSYVAKTLGIKL